MLLDFKGIKAMTHNLNMALFTYYIFSNGHEIIGIQGFLVINCVGTKKTGTAGWELEGFYGEWEVLIIWVVDHKAVVDGLLQALGFIALRDQRAGISRGPTFFNTGGLGESLIVSLKVVDDDSPFALSVDSSQRSDVGSLRGTEVSLFLQGCGPLNRQLSVELSYISIEVPELCEVIINCSLQFVSWVFSIFKAPVLSVVDRAGRVLSFVCMYWFVSWCWFIGSWLMVVSWSMLIRWGRMVGWCRLVRWWCRMQVADTICTMIDAGFLC